MIYFSKPYAYWIGQLYHPTIRGKINPKKHIQHNIVNMSRKAMKLQNRYVHGWPYPALSRNGASDGGWMEFEMTFKGVGLIAQNNERYYFGWEN